MQSPRTMLYTTAIATVIVEMPPSADILRSEVALNSGIGAKTANQPANGAEVEYQVTLTGGDIDGCTVDIVESFYPRDEGAWGIFDITGNATCKGGGFSYSSSGA